MERFRGLVQRFGGVSGVGGSGGAGGSGDGAGDRPRSRNSSDEAFDPTTALPLTTAFTTSTLPHAPIRALSASNATLAGQAHTLVRHIDTLLNTHHSAASELRTLLSSVPQLRRAIDDTTATATAVQHQLLELETLVQAAQADAEGGGLRELQRAEDARFEAYARERRARAADVRRGYEKQLEAFHAERVDVLRAEGSRRVEREREVRKKLAAVELEAEEGVEDFFKEEEEEEAGEAFLGEPAATPATTPAPAPAPTATAASKGKGKGKAKETPKGKAKATVKVTRPAPKKNPVIMDDEDLDPAEFDYKNL
ncbi:hypothetical protein EDC01DRAFT_745205 [Geopyxis carbonaria]|nr:hypothetical protein EDC01DRAFT_745205 [Geopyxis carbonaria]